MSSVRCNLCDREVTDRNQIVRAIQVWVNVRCKDCHSEMDITVTADDILLMPEPYRSEALATLHD